MIGLKKEKYINLLRSLLVLLVILSSSPKTIAVVQQEIQPQNSYSRVIEVLPGGSSLRINDPLFFSKNDTVLFHISKGAEIYNPTENSNKKNFWGLIKDVRNSGTYSIHVIQDIVSDTISFTTPLRELGAEGPGQVGQLVKIKTFNTLEIDTELTCPAWDPISATGGILVLFAREKIILNADIDVSGKGFSGGNPVDISPLLDTTSICFDEAFLYDPVYDNVFSGNPGENAVYEGFDIPASNIAMANGGGAGSGKFSGGGGGGNYSYGGRAGFESESCSPGGNFGGRAGIIDKFYYANDGKTKNRLFFGGGGGAGTYQDGITTASFGGNGGGIVIIITDSLISNGSHSILANGASVSDVVTGGAGGGGGAGCIVLDVANYAGNLNLEVHGGDGGNTDDPVNMTGPGAFGGAGVIWHNQDKLPNGTTTDLANGIPGMHIPSESHHGATTLYSGVGTVEKKLTLPMNSMLFNFIAEEYILYQDNENGPIPSSSPKGGDGVYKILWEISFDQVKWDTAPGQFQKEYYYPSDTIPEAWYRRIISSLEYQDTSTIAHVLVFEEIVEIVNNLISGNQEICGPSVPELITGTIVTAETQTVAYTWESSSTGNEWQVHPSSVDSPDFQPQATESTVMYRRIVSTGILSDTSNIVTIVTYPLIDNNWISNEQEICIGDPIESLNHAGEPVSGGTGSYKYSWEYKTGTEIWIKDITAGDSPEFSPESISFSSEYRRIIVSGLCADTSNSISIHVHYPPEITSHPVDQEVEEGATVTFSISASSPDQITYLWKHPSGREAPASDVFTLDNVMPEDEGFYYCAVKTDFCASVSDTAELTVKSGSTGIYDTHGKSLNLDVYPNPARDILFIEHSIEGEFSVQIHNLIGKLELEYRNSRELDISTLKPGNYIISIRSLDQKLNYTGRFIKSQ